MDQERLPFTFQSHTGSPTGYAETAAAMMKAFWQEGLEVHYLFVGDDPLYEPTSMDHMVDGLRSIEPEVGLPTIVYSTAPMFWHNGGKYKIGWTMMEVDGISQQWVRACNSQDEIWVPTPYQKEFFKESGVSVPIYVVPLGYDPTKYNASLTPAVYREEAKFRFFAMGWWQWRKRWDILLEAFDNEFGGNKDVALIIKTMSNEADKEIAEKAASYIRPENRDQVAVICGPLPWWEVAMITRSCHAFAMATSGEGWGCPSLHALACGLPVITTDCLGPSEVLRDGKGNPYPGVMFVPAEMQKCEVAHPYYNDRNWWVVDTTHFQQAMRAVYDNYKAWKESAMRGSELVKKDRGVDVTARIVRKQLERIYKAGI